MLRRGKLVLAVSSSSSYSDLVKIEVEGLGHLLCWKDPKRICKSDCTAWDVHEKSNTVDLLKCKALPEPTQEIAMVTVDAD